MKSFIRIMALLAVVFSVVACSGTTAQLPIQQIPAGNDKEIRIEKAYDFVYLATYDAVNELDGWTPLGTVKDSGLIRVQNKRFSRFDDSERRIVEIHIERADVTHTRVFLAPESQRVIGADELLAAIRKKLGVV